MLFAIFAIVTLTATSAVRVGQPYRVSKDGPRRQYEPAAPTTDILVRTDEEALFIDFTVPQGEVTYVAENNNEKFIIAEYSLSSETTFWLPLTMFQGNCSIVATTEHNNTYIIYIEN